MNCKLTPVNDKIVVQKIEEDSKSAGGIYMPEDKKEGTVLKGKVLAAGPGQINQFTPGLERLPMPVAEGDIIFYAGYQGNTVECGGEEYVVLSANEILCIMKEN